MINCFADIETQKTNEPSSALEVWYESARLKQFSELSIDDICRALRQNIAFEHVVKAALVYLRETPFAGAQYDGEMILALSYIPKEMWKSVPHDTRDELRSIIKQMDTHIFDDEEKSKLVKILDNMK